ncbi:MAG: M4 family metallopeptidase [Saprospiraceae bacterium]|nr:M4 family metallopeptidase [Saprospiraceae bacterium]
MKKVSLLILSLLFCFGLATLSAQNTLKQAKQIEQAQSPLLQPTFIRFESDKAPAFMESSDFANRFVGSSEVSSAKHLRTEQDELGFTHHRYQQMLDGIPIEGAEYVYHIKKGKVEAANGQWLTDEALNALKLKAHEKLSEQEALQKALQYMNAQKYKWELPDEEQHLKSELDDSNATYFPKGEKIFTSLNGEKNTEGVRLAWKFSIYAQEPLSRQLIYIDAENGAVLSALNQMHSSCMDKKTPASGVLLESAEHNHVIDDLTRLPLVADVVGTANTGYSGVQTIKCTPSVGKFTLRESEDGLGRGKGIVTLNLSQGTNFATAIDFTSTTQNWTLTGLDKYALDAHYGTEKVYDYYKTNFNRNSIDNAGFRLINYVHYGVQTANAYWDGSRMIYGDGNNFVPATLPFTALDIVGHEITHGLTQNTAKLILQGESGALNESFSDIFGTAVEFFAQPTAYAANWTMGERINVIARSLSDPKKYAQPNYYKGALWLSTTARFDDGGIHYNSGVQNHWFYLLATGGSGVNEKGSRYSITGIGIEKAAKIAYRNLTVYLTANAQYRDAYNGSLSAAIDLYGFNSPEYKSVLEAWCAVGLTSSIAAVNIAITSGKNPDCSGGSVTLTATPVNGGTNPTFQWKKDGVNVGTGLTYTDVGSTNGAITCVMTVGTGICTDMPTATSEAINLYKSSSPFYVEIAVTNGTNPTHIGSPVTFTAVPTNGGTNPGFYWYKTSSNGSSGLVSTSMTYTDPGTTEGLVFCQMVAGPERCAVTYVYNVVNLALLSNPAILYVKPTASGTGDGTSWANASSNLQEMIRISASGDQIWVAQGVYKPTTTSDVKSTFKLKDGVALYGGFAGNETSLTSRTPASIKTNETVLSGVLNGANSEHVVTCSSLVGNSTILDGFTITGGRINISTSKVAPSVTNSGAGLVNSGSPTIRNCSFVDNKTTVYGGAIYSIGNPIITNCSFFNNNAYSGGGICLFSGTATITGCSFENNSAEGALTYGAYRGGGIYISSATVAVTLTNCSFSKNTARNTATAQSINPNSGGAIFSGGAMTLTNCSFWKNTTNGGSTVQMDYTPSTNLMTALINCSFAANSGQNDFLIRTDMIKNYSSISIKNSILQYPFTYSDPKITVTNSIVPNGYAGVGNLNIAPNFVDTLNGNLSLQPNSGAINAGSNAAVPAGIITDLAGNPRFYNNGIVDMGAYEYQGVRQSAFASATNNNNMFVADYKTLSSSLSPIEMGIFPNPAKSSVNIQLKTEIATDGQILLSDITGKTVLTVDAHLLVGQNHIPIDISTLSNGIYLCQFKDAQNLVLPLKLVKY